MNVKIAMTVILIIFIIWSLHGLDLEYYTNNKFYNEGFDNNLKLAFYLCVLIVVLLLFSETIDSYTPIRNN